MRTLLRLFLLLAAPWVARAAGATEAARSDIFSYDGVDRVQVTDAQLFSVEAIGSPGSGLAAEVRYPAGSRVGIEHRRSGGTVMIRGYRRETLFGWLGSAGEHLLVLRVPADCELEIRTGTGSVTVSAVRGVKLLRTETGSISVSRSDGELVATTQTGSHRYTDLRGDLAASASTGGISIVGFEGAIAAETGTGRVEGSGLLLTGHSSFRTDTGSIALELAQPLDGFSFDLRTDTGRIVVGSTEARGRLVLGGGRLRLQAETDTGGIRITERQ